MSKQFLRRFVIWIITQEARCVLWKYKPKIIAVTGSVGKTSTKDALYTVLSVSFAVRKNTKSFNSEIGVPLTILGCDNAWSNPLLWLKNILQGLAPIIAHRSYPDWLVLEIGADRPGDIKTICSWLTPNIVVVTRFGDVPAHVEFFNSPAAVREEKGFLVQALGKDGVLVVNSDDPNVAALSAKTSSTVVTYGFEVGAAVRALQAHVFYKPGVRGVPLGMSFKIEASGSAVPVRVFGALGRQHVYPLLAAVAVGGVMNIAIEVMGEAANRHTTPPGRMKLIDGVKKSVLIDDTYNSSPVAALEALRVVQELKVAGRRVVAFGDMLELGKYSAEEHKKVGEEVARTADLLLTVGVRARSIAEGALTGGMSEKYIYQYEEPQPAGAFLQNVLKQGDVVLVKGSQSIRMERVVEEIMENPLEKEKLLVRQEPEWLARG